MKNKKNHRMVKVNRACASEPKQQVIDLLLTFARKCEQIAEFTAACDNRRKRMFEKCELMDSQLSHLHSDARETWRAVEKLCKGDPDCSDILQRLTKVHEVVSDLDL